MNATNTIKNASEFKNDALSKILSFFKMNVSIYQNAKVCGDWSTSERELGTTCFHIITANRCSLNVPKYFKGTLDYGDLVIFPKEIPHSMRSTKVQNIEPQFFEFKLSKTPDDTGLLCGEIHFNHKGSDAIIEALPPVIVIPFNKSRKWLQPILEMIIHENLLSGPASKTIINTLSELLFIYALRNYIFENSDKLGLLAVYTHPHIAQTIALIHEYPSKDWTLGEMAKEAGLSRTSFSETFKSISGKTPFQYLLWWRMQIAWSLLLEGENISEVANKIGYKSESAFSHAFKAFYKTSAGKVRKTLAL